MKSFDYSYYVISYSFSLNSIDQLLNQIDKLKINEFYPLILIYNSISIIFMLIFYKQ